ncbi:MAG: helix-turn-helix domain-containing protein [Candidatus Nanopelagicales bacterium]|jgi:AraC family transcriptional regulator of adaptative response / DNA-3-methyladenine glycosylase II|nr:helix-turn-helix domain-containing protein [Candidatus Nanopelagicales bacterium]
MDLALDHERCYRAVASRDARFDGSFYTAVRTTGIYCRPSCPAITPNRRNVTFFRTAAAAQRDGFRACRRCRPDAVPGSPEWNVRGDVVARAMRLVADGAVERVGVAGVASALGYSERHLTRLVTEELGAGLLAIARTQRAHTARILLETTDLPASEVAWAAGFGSIRSFNDTITAVYGEAPTALRDRRGGPGTDRQPSAARLPTGVANAPIRVRLATRQPFGARALLTFLGQRCVAGLEEWDGRTYRRTLDLPHGHAAVACHETPGGLLAEFWLADLRDLAPGVARVRRLFDLDADPVAVSDLLGADPLLGPLVAARAGLRVPGSVDPHEIVIRAIVGQQVSVAGAATVVGRLVAAHGEPLAFADPALTHVFPTVDRLADADPEGLSMPRARGAALVGICRGLADGEVVLDPGIDRAAIGALLEARPGIGPWTADYVRMRGLGDPDVMLAGDLGVRHAVAARGGDDRRREIERVAHAWRPWRSYAVAHLWASLEPPDPGQVDGGRVSGTTRPPGADEAPAAVRAGAPRSAGTDARGTPNPDGGPERPTHAAPSGEPEQRQTTTPLRRAAGRVPR